MPLDTSWSNGMFLPKHFIRLPHWKKLSYSGPFYSLILSEAKSKVAAVKTLTADFFLKTNFVSAYKHKKLKWTMTIIIDILETMGIIFRVDI